MLIDAFAIFFDSMARLQRLFTKLLWASQRQFCERTLQTAHEGKKYHKCID